MDSGSPSINPDRAQLGALSQHNLDQRELLHPDVSCVGCGASRIYGIRYQCPLCISYNLCERCEDHADRRTMNGHPKEHAFLKIRIPIIESDGPFVPIGGAGPIGYDWK